MANWAIVIGVNEYWKPAAHLRGAVRDALSFSEWLVSVDGGAVPTNNLTLLLSPPPNEINFLANPRINTANRDNIFTELGNLLERSNGEGERFYFYFSGHGLSSRINFSNVSCLIPSDFSSILPDKAFSTRSIFDLFQGTDFREQFFFIDACRNVPAREEEFNVSNYPRPRRPKLPIKPQFIMNATSQGLQALELQFAGNERGAFTNALLRGLQGDGIAKKWDDDAQEYIVRWLDLFNYVEADVLAKKLEVGNNLIQAPKQTGERGSENPIMGRFRAGTFPNVSLEVNLDPEVVKDEAQVIVTHPGGEIARRSTIQELPVTFFLEPRTYSVRAAARTYRPRRDYYSVDLYSSESRTFELSPMLSGESPLSEEAVAAELTKGLSDEPLRGSIEIVSNDPLAHLELADNSGKLIRSDEGSLYEGNLSPGFYRARLRPPEGNYVEELIELLPGPNEKIRLDAPKPPDSALFKSVIETAEITIDEDNTIEPSEAVGPVATAHLSTLLALAGGLANENAASDIGGKLRRIGINSFQQLIGGQAENGIQILFGVEASDPEQISVQCWEQLRPTPEEAEFYQPVLVDAQDGRLSGLAQFALEKPPSTYWLSIKLPNQQPVAISVSVLPQRLTLIVFSQNAYGDVNIYQYLPSLTREDPYDERKYVATYPVLQRSELIQRAYMDGRLEAPLHNARMLLWAKWVEPIAGCLGGYIMLGLKRADDLEIASRNMTNHFGWLSDSHILRAEYFTSQGQFSEAKEAYQSALDRGVPIFRDGLILLKDGIERHQIIHPQVSLVEDVFKNHIRNLIWTAIPIS